MPSKFRRSKTQIVGGSSVNHQRTFLMGYRDDYAWSGSEIANYIDLQKVTPGFLGTNESIKEIRVYCSGAGNVKVGVYRHNAATDEPDVRLAWSEGTACVAGWNTIKLNVAVAVRELVPFWLACNSSASIIKYKGGLVGVPKIGSISAAYANALPATVPGGISYYTTYAWAIGAWGVIA